MPARIKVKQDNIPDPFSELEQALKIDKNDLDEDWIKQPSLFYEAAKQYAMAISRRDAAKQALAEEEAEADRAIRKSAVLNDEKITVNEVAALVKIDDGVKSAANHLIECSTQVAKLSALQDAFRQRADALKSLSSLYIAGYFGDVANRSSYRSQAVDNAASMAREAIKRQSRSQRE